MPGTPGSYCHTTEEVVGTFQLVDLNHDRILRLNGELVQKLTEGTGCRDFGDGWNPMYRVRRGLGLRKRLAMFLDLPGLSYLEESWVPDHHTVESMERLDCSPQELSQIQWTFVVNRHRTGQSEDDLCPTAFVRQFAIESR
jgi:hypothetical protein